MKQQEEEFWVSQEKVWANLGKHKREDEKHEVKRLESQNSRHRKKWRLLVLTAGKDR